LGLSQILHNLWINISDPAYKCEEHWQLSIRQLARQPGIFLDIGSGSPYQGHVKAHDIGLQTRYFSLDIRLSARPHIAADIMRLPVAWASVDVILCNAVLEHIPDPQTAVNEMYRVLRPKGQLLVSVPFIYPFHDRTDYYRFSDMALEHMFAQFTDVEIHPMGDYLFAALLFLTGFNFWLAKWFSPLLHLLRFALHSIVKAYNNIPTQRQRRNYLRSLARSPVGWYVFCRKA
jgi:SAM-dependent methyltransferase